MTGGYIIGHCTSAVLLHRESLELMNAGILTSFALASVTMWLITKNNPEEGKIGNYNLLTELMGIED